jgi:hypothetical protein
MISYPQNEIFTMIKYLLYLFICVVLIANPIVVLAEEIVVSENGSGTANVVATQTTSETIVVQTNNTDIQNAVSLDANTGQNIVNDSSSNASIITGDSTTDLQVVNQANSNVLVNPCCEDKKASSEISENGSNSENSINSTQINSSTYVSKNNATIKTSIKGMVNTGKNKVSDNTGSAKIVTGDIYVNTSIKNASVNNSIVVMHEPSVKHIDDKAVKQNGALSKNNILHTEIFDNQIFIDNNAVILNEVLIDANTGSNLVRGNIGEVKIVTGNILTDLLIDNVNINTSVVSFTCCTEGIDVPVDPNPVNPTTPNKTQSGSSNNSASNSSSSIGGIGGTNILGLSDTSSGEKYDLRFWVGFISMVLGISFIIGAFERKSQDDKNITI